jgi:hypothetical protein
MLLFTAVNPRFVETPNDYTPVAALQAKLGNHTLIFDFVRNSATMMAVGWSVWGG